MPELPEVETIRRQLAPQLEGWKLVAVQILDPRWTRPMDTDVVERTLTGAEVKQVGRSGKYLLWTLSGDRHLIMHLRMTGTLLLDPVTDPPHTRVRFELEAGAAAAAGRNLRRRRLVYVDPRRFGTGHLLHGHAARNQYLAARLGAEPLTLQFTPSYLRHWAGGRTAPVKAFLLDQKRVAGVGNIYADEALFRAGIHPARAAGRLTASDWARLHHAVEQALKVGIEAKGASIDDFRHVDGARGAFQDRFLVHRRAGEPCPSCGHPIRKIVVAGRGTYVCERCQRRPRSVARRRYRSAGPLDPPPEADQNRPGIARSRRSGER